MSVFVAIWPEPSRSFHTVKMFSFPLSCHVMESSVVCVQGDRQTVMYPPFQPHMAWMNTQGSTDSSDMPRAGRQKERSLWNGVVRHSVEFHRMWGKTRMAYSCFLPDTEGGRWRAKERKREGRGRARARERALRSVIFTDVAAALGQTLPVFCVHLRLVSPVLL